MERIGVIFMCIVGIRLIHGITVDVETAFGTVRGTYEAGPSIARVNKFRGIPYAEPPVGDLRFLPPTAATSWSGTYSAESFKQRCIQMNSGSPLGSEDCLYLNIYVPEIVTERIATPIPVMIYIHGESRFDSGSAEDYTPDELTNYDTDSSVIVVTFNYRLGVFGFLSSGDNVIPGNMGFKDQSFAIQWVHDNIASFGGDNTKITIFGQSSGGTSVKAQILSPMNNNKFHRAIVQSGLSIWKFPDKSFHTTNFIDFGTALSCQSDSMGIRNCLQSKTADEILTTAGLQFGMPVIDGEFLDRNPEEILASGDYNHVDLMVGFNSDDGTAWFAGMDTQQGVDIAFGFCTHLAASELGSFYNQDETFPYQVNVEGILNMPQLLEDVKARYSPRPATDIETARELLDSMRDCAYIVQSLEMAEKFASDGGLAYVYYFDHRSSTEEANVPNTVQLEAPHGGEIPYVFGVPITGGGYTDAEGKLSQSMVQAWTTFAKAGAPTYADLGFNDKPWPAYTAAEKKIVVFDMDGLSPTGDAVKTAASIELQSVLNFWTSFRKSVQYDYTTVDPNAEAQNSCSEEFRTKYLELDNYEADLTIFLLAIGAFVLLLLVIGLACAMCTKNKAPKEDKYAY